MQEIDPNLQFHSGMVFPSDSEEYSQDGIRLHVSESTAQGQGETVEQRIGINKPPLTNTEIK
jgi:hypothetical protein